MKLINTIVWIFFVPVLLFTGCKKDSTDNLSKIVKVSFPEITLNGPALAIVTKGATYTDAGAKLKDDITGAITDIQPIENNVNTAVPGVYVVNFLAANGNGFEVAVSRTVAVAGVSGNVNRAGTYKRTSNGINAVITKLAEGVYEIKNAPGFGGGANTVLYMVETSPNVYTVPEQPTDNGNMSLSNITFTATGVSWVVHAIGFGTATRIFVKQ